MDLTIKQTRALDFLEDTMTDEVLFGGGAGGGKSALGCFWILKCCVKYPGSRWVIGRSQLKTLKETTQNSLSWVLKQQGFKVGVHFKFNAQNSQYTFTNGSQILLKDLKYYPSDPNFDELGSLEITGAFVDECNQITQNAWSILKSRIRYRLNDYCHVCGSERTDDDDVLKYNENAIPERWVCCKGHKTSGLRTKILGTCNPAKNWTYTDFYEPDKSKTIEPRRKFVQALLSDNKNTSSHYKENLLTLDKVSKERLLFGNWEYDDDPATLCTFDKIKDCFNIDGAATLNGKKFITSDLAMQGRDRFVITSWNDFTATIEQVKGKSDGKEIERDLRKYISLRSVPRSNVCADSDGLGNYLESYLKGIKEFHANARANDSEKYANLKSECAFKLAELINKGLLKIICTDKERELIMAELGCLKRADVDKDEKRLTIISKEKMKETLGRSPDFLDTLIFRGYWECTPQVWGVSA